MAALSKDYFSAQKHATPCGKRIPSDYVNDNFCDCKDGTDEPGGSHLHILGSAAPNHTLAIGALSQHAQGKLFAVVTVNLYI